MHFHHLKLFYLSKWRNEQKRYVPFMRCAICYICEYYYCIAFLSRHCRGSGGGGGGWGRICNNCLDGCRLSWILFFYDRVPSLIKEKFPVTPIPLFLVFIYLFILLIQSCSFRLVVLSRPSNLVCPVILAITRSVGEMDSCLFQVY